MKIASLISGGALCLMVLGCSGTSATTGSAGSGTASSVGSTGSSGGSGTSGGTATGGSSVSGSSTGSITAATTRRPFPQIPNQNGPILSQPKLVLVSYADDADQPQNQAFATWLVQSPWLSQVGADYGVGLGSIRASIILDADSPATLDESQLGPLLDQMTQDAGILPPPDDDTIYTFFFATHTVLTGPSGPICGTLGAYHSSYASPFWSQNLRYIVVPTCSDSPAPLMAPQWREVYLSHELMEAATDPDPLLDPAFDLTDPANDWTGEVGDLCTGTFLAIDAGLDAGSLRSAHLVETRWRPTAASFPCLPLNPSFVALAPTTQNAQIVEVPPGGSTVLQLVGWSGIDAGAFEIAWAPDAYSYGNLNLSVQLEEAPIQAGEPVTAMLLVPSGTQNGAYTRIETIATAADQEIFAWPILIQAQ